MPEGLNRVELIGNLGQDPEIKYTQSGTAVVNLSVATNERRKVGDNWEDVVEWHRVVVWAKTAEACNEYLRKGSQVYIDGKLQTRKWEDREGNERYTTEINANRVMFLSKEGGSGAGGGSYNDGPSNRAPSDGIPSGGNDGIPQGGGDDIPF